MPVREITPDWPWREPYVSRPNLHTRSPTATKNMIMMFSGLKNEHHCKRNGVKRISFNMKFGNYVPKWVKTFPPSKSGFQHPISICTKTEVYWWCLGGKNSSVWDVVSACMHCLCQNRPNSEADFPFWPQQRLVSAWAS